MTEPDPYVAELLAERRLPAAAVWDAAEARLDRPVAEGLNTAHEVADRWARDRARLAIIVRHPDGRSDRWTYADLSRASSRLATAWRAAGVQRGDRVAALVSQQIEAYIASLAAWRAGFVYVPLFIGFGPDALAQRLNASEPAVIVVDHRYRDQLLKAQHLLTGDPQIYAITESATGPAADGDRGFWAAIEAHSADCTPVVMAASDAATLIFTSGTTGPAKGCIQPHSLIVTLQPFVRHVFGLRPGDMLFTGANPGWSYGLYATGAGPMAMGFPRVVYSGDFDPEQWLRVFEEEQVTYLAAAPSAYRKLIVAAHEHGLSDSVRGATSAGEPLDAPLAQAWRELSGSDLQDGYGQSESAMMLANLAHDETPIVPGALTSVVPGFEIELVDDDGVAGETAGIIAMRKPRYQASTGYRNADELWAQRWRGDLFLTGDLARRDEQGRYFFTGRADDLIVTSGYNVGPTEVENIVLAHPGVADAAVVGAPDAARGTVVRAVIVLNGTVAEAQVIDEVKATVKEQLGRHAYPRIVDVVDELPRTETGKIRRNVLRDPTLA